MDLLQEIQVSGTRKNPFAEVALERLLDANLSAKYSLTGQLSTYVSLYFGIHLTSEVKLHVAYTSCNCKLLLRGFSYDCWEAFSFFHSLTIAGSTNLIEDGFYDAGQIRPNTKFMSIEDYCKQELNDKRPILFINAKAEYVKKCKINLTNPNFEYLGILFVQISPSFIFLELHFL